MKVIFVNNLKRLVLGCFLIAGLIPMVCTAQDVESHDNIIETAYRYINSALEGAADKEIHISPLNKNLRLHSCSQPLDAFITPGVKLSGRTTIGVRCSGSKPWKIYVTAVINIFDNVVIADAYILRGSRLAPSQLRTEKRNIATLTRGYFTKPADVIGKIAKTAINKEKVVTPYSLASAKLVQRGKNVTIVAKSDTVTVKMNGNAMSDGHMGEIIKVKNLRSHRIIDAEVIDTNLVRVAM